MEEVKENAVIADAQSEQPQAAQAEAVQTETLQAEGGEVKAQKHRKIKIMPLVAFVSNVFYLVIQTIIMIMFLTGMSPLFGEGFTIVSCINYVINIFNVNLATAYNYVCGCVFTIIYIAFVVVMIKSLCSSVKRLISLIKITFSKPDENNPIKPPAYPLNIYYPCIRTFFLAICFTGLANLVSYNTLSDSIITCMVFAGICTVANAVIPLFNNFSKEKISLLALTAVREILGYTVVCLLVTFINHAVLKEFINGFVMIFSGNMITADSNAKAIIYAIYNNIVSPVLFIILAAQVLGVISKHLTYHYERRVSGNIISQLIYTGIYMILHLVFKLILVSGSFDVSMIGDWLNIMKTDLLPVFLLMITLLLIEIPFQKNN